MVEDIQPGESDQRSPEAQRAVERLLRAFRDTVIPTQKSLDAMLHRARAFRVVRFGVTDHRPIEKIVLEGRDEKTLADLRHFLQIVEPTGSCFCAGDPRIDFLDESGVCIAAIGVKHGRLRWSAWVCDASLVDGLGLVKWFAANGVTDPHRERAREAARAVLGGQITVLEGVSRLRHLADPAAIDDEKDRALIIAFATEIPSVPVGDVRKLWAPYALEMKDQELARAKARWTKGFLEACERIAEA
jgi:hypothetical protein